MDSNLTFSTLSILDCFFEPFVPREGEPPLASDKLAAIPKLLEPWFIFAIIWAVGGNCEAKGREAFDQFMRKKMVEVRLNAITLLSINTSQNAYFTMYLVYCEMHPSNTIV